MSHENRPLPNHNDFKTKKFIDSCYNEQRAFRRRDDKERAKELITYVIERIFSMDCMPRGSGRGIWRKERKDA